MSEKQVILPDFDMRGGKRRGRVYVDAEDLVAYLLKAASEPDQEPAAVLFARTFAEMIREGFR